MVSSLCSEQEEKVFASIIFGMLGGRWQSRILEQFDVDKLGFSSFIGLFKNKARQDDCEGLAVFKSESKATYWSDASKCSGTCRS